MKKIQTLLAVAALSSTALFAAPLSVLEIDFNDGAIWNSVVTGSVKLVGTGSVTLGSSASVTAGNNIELNAGQAKIGNAGLVSSGGFIQLDAGVQLNVTAAITPDPINMNGAATINNAANAITLTGLTGTGAATLTGTGVVTMHDLSGNSGGFTAVNVALDGSTKYPTADSSATGVATISAAPAQASLYNLTFNEIDASYSVGANDFIAAGTTGKVLKATKLSIGANTWSAAVTAH